MPVDVAMKVEDLDEVLTFIGVRLFWLMEEADKQRPGWHREAPELVSHLLGFLTEVLPDEGSDVG